MDSSQPNQSIVNRFVSGFKEKTVKLAESKLAGVFTEEVPDEAILSFVASAVVLGAQRLEVRVQANDLILTHDGRKLTEMEATNLHRGVQSLPELSKGARLHLGKDNNSQIEIHFLTETDMYAVRYKGLATPTSGQVDLGDLALAKMTNRVILKGSGNYRRVNQAMGNELPEINLIRKRCFLAPIDINISGRTVDRYGYLPESIMTGTNFDTEHHVTLSTLATTPSWGIPCDLGSLKGQLHAIKAGICGIARSTGDSGWFQLVNGIARPLNVAWPTRSWGFVKVQPGLPPDRLENEMGFLINALTAELFKSLRNGGSDRAEDALSFLEQNRAVLTHSGYSQVEQDSTFLKLREQLLPSSDPRVLNNRLELASSLEASGQTGQAEELYSDVLPVWESEALNHFDKYRFEEGASLWQRALSLREKLGTDPNDLVDKYVYLAEIGREQRMGFAEQAFRRALQLHRNCGVDNKEREYKILLGLAQVLRKNRVLTESLKLAETAQQLMQELHDGRETKALVPVLKLQAEIHDLLNDYGRSTEFEQKAMLLKFKR